MCAYVLTTDNTADLPKEFLEEKGIKTIPLRYTVEGVTYPTENGEDLAPESFYAKMRGGEMPVTTQATPAEFEDFFTPTLEAGMDVLHICFSSGLSGSYGSAQVASASLMERYPERRVIVIDSLCASMGEGLLVYYACLYKEEGLPLEEAAKKLEHLKGNICHMFTVDDLHHLHRGGRVSKAAAVVGTMLNVKPVLHVDDAGHLVPTHKVRGRKQSLQKLVSLMAEKTAGFENPMVFISHGDCEADALYVKDLVREQCGAKDFMVNFIGPTIGTHSGPGTVALFFVGEPR